MNGKDAKLAVALDDGSSLSLNASLAKSAFFACHA